MPAALRIDVRPRPRRDGGDAVGVVGEAVPRDAAGVDDGIAVVPDADREPVGVEVLPDVPDGVRFGVVWRQRDERDVFGQREVMPAVPAGAVEDVDGRGARSDGAGDHGEMGVHRRGAGEGHDDAGGCPARWADRAEGEPLSDVVRSAPSTASASAGIRRDACGSRHFAAADRNSTAVKSLRVIATARNQLLPLVPQGIESEIIRLGDPSRSHRERPVVSAPACRRLRQRPCRPAASVCSSRHLSHWIHG